MRRRESSTWRVGAALALWTATAALGVLNLECSVTGYTGANQSAAMAERPTGALGDPRPGADGGAPGGPPAPPPAQAAPPPPTLSERPSLPTQEFAPKGPKDLRRDDPATLHREAEAYRDQADYTRAEPLYQRARQLLETKVGVDDPEYAAVLNNLGEMYREQGRYAEAEPIAQRALDIRDRQLGPTNADAATSADNLAWLLWQRGDYARAQPLAERALEARQGAYGKDHPVTAISLTTLGVLLWEKGDYTHAEPLLARVLRIEEKALQEATKKVGGVEGEKQSNTPLVRRPGAALASAVGKRGGVRSDLAIALDNLGGLYWDKGDYARAEPLFQRALKFAEQARGPTDISVAIPLSLLAKAALERDDYKLTEELYVRALGIWVGALGRDHPKVAIALANLGALYVKKGDHAHAEPLIHRALEINEKTLGKDHPLVGDATDDLATLYRETGDLTKARPLAERALAIRRKAFGESHPVVAEAWRELSALSLAEGNLRAAIDAEERGATILDHHAAVLLTAGSEDQKRAYMAKLQKATDDTISLHAHRAPADPRATRLALTTILRRKGGVLDAMSSGIAALRKALTPEARDLLDRLAAVLAELGTGVLRGQGRISTEQFQANITKLEAERQRLERKLSALSAAVRAPLRDVTIEEVQAAIPEGAALVEISLFAPFNERANRPTARHDKPRYAAYVLKRSGAPSFVDLGEAEPIDKEVEYLREALANPTRDPRTLSRRLGDRLMKPLSALLGDHRRVILSPDGALNLLPFDALLDEDGRYLIDRWSFTYLTTGRELVHAEPRAKARDPALVIADPDFGPQSTPKATGERGKGAQRSFAILSNVQFFRLQGTITEGRAVEERIAGARMLTGQAASEQALKATHGPRIIHIATHGFFLPREAEPDGPRGLDNPLLRAGLALAGANQRTSEGEDGVLTALEASSLDLHGTKLVVLSACETGIGDAARGEGVYGLRRALSIAGAETQVMSLWKVDDDATRALMVAYYTGLRAGQGRGEAMRAAQRSLLGNKMTSHPYYWASFVVSGDGSPLDEAPRAGSEKGMKVQPGARGCSCAEAGRGSSDDAALALGLAGLAIVARRRRAKP